MPLNARQQRFIDEYLIDLNATQAAIRAGYSENGSTVQGTRLLANASIAAALREAMDLRAGRTGVTADKVLREYAKIGFSDIRKVTKWGSKPEPQEGETPVTDYPVELIPSDQIDDDTAAAVSEISLTSSGIKIKMHDKRAALDSIARHLGMFIETHEIIGDPDQPVHHEIVMRIVKPKT